MKRSPGATLAALLFLAFSAAAQDAGKLEADAKKAFDAGRFKDAGDKFAQAAAAEGAAERKADLYLQSAWAHYIGGNTKSAREGLKSAFSANPQLQVIADFYSPDFSRLAQSVRAEAGGPSSLPADVEEGKRDAREMLSAGKPDDAIARLKRIESAPDPQVHRLLAEAYERLGRAGEADAARRRASDLERSAVTSSSIGAPPSTGVAGSISPVSVAPLLEAAEKALAAGDARVAETLARRAADAEPRNAQARRLVGEAALALGEDGEAEKAFTASVALDSNNAAAQFGLARVAERQKKWSTAASHYRRALDLDPRNVGAARGLGHSMEELGDAMGGRLAYGRAVEIDPANGAAHNDLGVFLFRSGETDRAIEELIEAVRLEPHLSVFHENLARMFRKKGMLKEAEREMAEAGSVAPNEGTVWATLGHLRAEMKKPEDAARAYASAFNLDPANVEAASGLGAALAEAGKLSEADEAIEKALVSSPESAVLWNDLGVVRTRRGDFPRAVQAFEKAIALDARLEAARSNLDSARQLLALERAMS